MSENWVGGGVVGGGGGGGFSIGVCVKPLFLRGFRLWLFFLFAGVSPHQRTCTFSQYYAEVMRVLMSCLRIRTDQEGELTKLRMCCHGSCVDSLPRASGNLYVRNQLGSRYSRVIELGSRNRAKQT